MRHAGLLLQPQYCDREVKSMICQKCGADEFVRVSIPDSKSTTIIISAENGIASEKIVGAPKTVSVCKHCGDVTTTSIGSEGAE